MRLSVLSGLDLPSPTVKLPSSPTIKVPPIPPNPQVELQRGILRARETQNEVLVTLLGEAKHTGRQTTWTVRFAALSVAIAAIALGVAVYFGTRDSAPAPTPTPTPSTARSATP